MVLVRFVRVFGKVLSSFGKVCSHFVAFGKEL